MYEWDENKNLQNVEKHGIDFETAQQIFSGRVMMLNKTSKNYGEVRYTSIGEIKSVAVIAVIHTDRAGKMRLISARPASRKERRLYYETL